MHIANQSIIDIAKKDEKEELRLELVARSQARGMRTASVSGAGERETQSYSSSTRLTSSTMPLATSPFFVLRSTPRGKPSNRSVIKNKGGGG